MKGELTMLTQTNILQDQERAEKLVAEAKMPYSKLDAVKSDVSNELEGKVADYKIEHRVKNFFYSKSKVEGICLDDMLEESDNAIKSAVITSKREAIGQKRLNRKYINQDIPEYQRRIIDQAIKSRVVSLNEELTDVCKLGNAENLSPDVIERLKENIAVEKLAENPENSLEKAALELFMGQSFGTDKKKLEELTEAAKKNGLLTPCLSGLSAGATLGSFGGAIGAGVGAVAGAAAGICFGVSQKNNLESKAIAEKGIRLDLLQSDVVNSIKKSGKSVNTELDRQAKEVDACKYHSNAADKAFENAQKTLVSADFLSKTATKSKFLRSKSMEYRSEKTSALKNL